MTPQPQHQSQPTGDHWAPDRIPDQSGRTAVVTGSNSGIGYVTARELGRRGAVVVLACRNLDRAQEAVAGLTREVHGGQFLVRPLDLGDLRSVRAFAESWDLGPLDLLVNNAGVALVPRRLTADGFESQFGVNLLGHFALTGLLMPHLLAAHDPRVVSVTSESQRWGRMTFGNVNAERRYGRLSAYMRSKKAKVYFAVQLQRLVATANVQLRSIAVVPGFTATGLLTGNAHAEAGAAWRLLVAVANRFGKSTAEGAASSLYAATVANLPGGSYVAPGGLLELRGEPAPRNGRRAVYDVETARRLWSMAEQLTGVTYQLPADVQSLRQ